MLTTNMIEFQNFANAETLFFSVSIKSTHKQNVARICGDEFSFFIPLKTSDAHIFS